MSSSRSESDQARILGEAVPAQPGATAAPPCDRTQGAARGEPRLAPREPRGARSAPRDWPDGSGDEPRAGTGAGERSWASRRGEGLGGGVAPWKRRREGMQAVCLRERGGRNKVSS